VDANEILVEKIILAAEIETTMKKLLEDIERPSAGLTRLSSR